MSDEPIAIDWAAIRNDWEKSDRSIKWLASWYKVSDTAIRKKAKKDNWPARPSAVRAQVRADEQRTDPVMMAGIDATDPDQIVGRGHNLIYRLLVELDATTTHAGELEDMIVSAEDDPRRRAALQKAVSLAGRADVVKALALAFKTWNESPAAGKGKKQQRQAKAEEAAGKFAPRSRPAIVVNNDKAG